MIMGDSMESVMRPYFIVAFFMGCGIYRHPKGHPRLCLSIIYLYFVWNIYAFSFQYILFRFAGQPISRLLTFFTVYINLFLSMLSIFITFRKHEVRFFSDNITMLHCRFTVWHTSILYIFVRFMFFVIILGEVKVFVKKLVKNFQCNSCR